MFRSVSVLLCVALTACPKEQPEPEPEECSTADLPLQYTTLTGYSGSEDFAFGPDGGLVSVDPNGNLTSRKRDGTERIIAPGFEETAGTAYTPSGDLIIADALNGVLLRVTPNGGVDTLLSGLTYPNGVWVHSNGDVYTADQDTGIVWRVDAQTGNSEQIATGLFAPNGVAVGAENTVYVGSFGGGTLTAIRQTDSGWAAPEVVGTVLDESEPGGGQGGCEQAGEACLTGNFTLGACTVDLACEPVQDTAACDGLSAGDPCTTTVLGTSVDSLCVQDGELFCPYTPAANIAACDDLGSEDSCSVNGTSGDCFATGQNVLACYEFDYPEDSCTNAGDECVFADTHYPGPGECIDFDGDVFCEPSGGLGDGESGGLDGIAIDACDNVYLTEYIAGRIWRFEPGNPAPEVAVDLPSGWIPNMHWGNGVGGWQTDVLYVMDRDEGRVFELAIDVEAKTPALVGTPESSNE